MNKLILTAEDLLAGQDSTFELAIPESLLGSGGGEKQGNGEEQEAVVIIKPLSIGLYLLIMKAAKDDPSLIPLLMIKEALASPRMSLEQIKQMRVGLIEYLIEAIRDISGLGKKNSSRASSDHPSFR